MGSREQARPLNEVATPSRERILNPESIEAGGGISGDRPVLVILAAGRGTRFGTDPKCVQHVCGLPLARHSMNAFEDLGPAPVICLVGHRYREVMTRLGGDSVYVRSENPTGGTGFAAYEALSVAELEAEDALLIITMGDRIVTTPIFRRLCETHRLGPHEADLTMLSAIYEPPRHRGKGRLVRDADRRVVRILEQRDIDAMSDSARRRQLLDLMEGNCPLYAVRARTLRHYLDRLTNDNAQRQYYLTDIVERISRNGGEIRTITTTVADQEYDLLCSDVTRPRDLALLEGVLTSAGVRPPSAGAGIEETVETILADRSRGQVLSVACQLEELGEAASREELGFLDNRPIGIGLAGGRLRIAFMHPDMGRFFGPAWQMPTGAADAEGREQILVVVQSSDDGNIHYFPTEPQFREKLNSIPADSDCMYPGENIADWYAYERFGTQMAENLLLSLGYFSDDELRDRKQKLLPLPPPSLWISNSMRRPFSLIGNAIASMRTLREGNLGAKVQTCLGRDSFRGLRLASTGDIPQGGFSSSSAITVAIKNAMNALFGLGISRDVLVHLACQAEYGTGVRAGSLDQATEQKGKFNQGALISSNPRDNYRVIGVYPVPTDRFQVLFPYSVDRDRAAWQWSAGTYAATPNQPEPTAVEVRKMTGKAAEIAAVLTRLPLETDFFPEIEEELVEDGVLGTKARRGVCRTLRELPLLATQGELRLRLAGNRKWYMQQLAETEKLDAAEATSRTDATFEALFAGWRDPLLRRALPNGRISEEAGTPLRAMLAYLFGEVAKNFYLIHNPDAWIEYVTRSQSGDRCFDVDPRQLPAAGEMLREMSWENGLAGPELLKEWLGRYSARPVDFNRGLDDESLSGDSPPPLHLMEGGSFFRGLALIDLAEAMLKRAFGSQNIAVRVNAAGQGDYFQVHVDSHGAAVKDVKQFIHKAFYGRFGLSPDPEFVEPRPGGGAVGVRLSRFDMLPDLVRKLRQEHH